MSTHLTHDALETTAMERVLKARTELIMTHTFYGVALGQVVPVISRKVKTAATNGKQHYWNPDYIAGLKKNHLGQEVPVQKLVLGVQVHENEHDVRRHHTRRGGRDPLEWNIACDYSENCDIIDAGFDLPEGALIDRKYKGMSAEDVYRSREIDRALQKQKEEEEHQKQEEQRKQQAQDEQDDADEQDDNRDVDGHEAPQDEQNDAGQEEAGDEEQDAESTGGDAGQDDGSEQGNSDGSNEGNSGRSESDTADTEGTGEGEGGEATGLADTPGTASGEAGNGAGEGGSEPQSVGDPGNCGEVLDAAQDTAELSSEDARWETVLRQAAMLAAKRGTAPGHVAREIEHADHPPQDWRETLRAFFDQGATRTETWNKPNRRFVGGGLYLPGSQRDGINKVVFMIDTSGSVTYYPGALEAIKVETQAALDEGIIDSAVILYGDTQVTRVDEYRNGDEIEFDPRGGGGTLMRPLFDYVRNEVDDASLIVAFTDLEIESESQLGGEPHCPVLWAVVGYPQNVKRYLANTPWQAPGIEVVPSYN